MQLPTGFACSFGKAKVIVFDKVSDKEGYFQRSECEFSDLWMVDRLVNFSFSSWPCFDALLSKGRA